MIDFDQLPPGVQRKFQELYLNIQPSSVASKLWERLTPRQRKKLGDDFCQAYARARGTAEMWVELTGVSPPRAILDAARTIGWLNEADYEWLLHGVGEGKKTTRPSRKPRWNRDRGELAYQGCIVWKTRSITIAKNITAIFDAFQEQGWPERIADPLPGIPDPQRLREAVRSINARLIEGSGLRFYSDGTGEGIRWECC